MMISNKTLSDISFALFIITMRIASVLASLEWSEFLSLRFELLPMYIRQTADRMTRFWFVLLLILNASTKLQYIIKVTAQKIRFTFTIVTALFLIIPLSHLEQTLQGDIMFKQEISTKQFQSQNTLFRFHLTQKVCKLTTKKYLLYFLTSLLQPSKTLVQKDFAIKLSLLEVFKIQSSNAAFLVHPAEFVSKDRQINAHLFCQCLVTSGGGSTANAELIVGVCFKLLLMGDYGGHQVKQGTCLAEIKRQNIIIDSYISVYFCQYSFLYFTSIGVGKSKTKSKVKLKKNRRKEFSKIKIKC